jgi:hypothetical protein
MAELAAYHGFSLRAVLMRDTYRNLVDSTLQTWLSWFPEGEMGYTAASNPVDFKLVTYFVHSDYGRFRAVMTPMFIRQREIRTLNLRESCLTRSRLHLSATQLTGTTS